MDGRYTENAGAIFGGLYKNLNTGKIMMNSQVTRWHWWRLPV
jgi:hypothetical protein